MTLEHRHIRERLDHFLDGELPDPERITVQEHLGRCDECLAEVEALRGIRAGALALPREIAPARDLWPGIAARIQSGVPAEPPANVIRADFGAARRYRGSTVWVIRIAAALALVVISSSVTAWLLRGPVPVATLPQRVVQPQTTTSLAAFAPMEAEYRSAVETLSIELAARRQQLSPETIATVEENLRIIDQAIAEARAALRANPANAEIPLLLSGVYRQKVELLQNAVQLSVS